ncbi:hypothetical protein [Caldimonas tepidiphila]|uniref:hypothetical protein n=1 Tax=Caldimonas tepidiphila TaxID=2315841 RepID=UPI000E5ACF6F|nr:hypothetical protein [Caldimonas tepidiphila]
MDPLLKTFTAGALKGVSCALAFLLWLVAWLTWGTGQASWMQALLTMAAAFALLARALLGRGWWRAWAKR